MNIARQHLALLGVLDALLTERSVTKAADRLHLTQPAMSNALSKLRELFDDPLLVREGREMVLTPKAHRISSEVSAIVASASALLEEANAFEPRHTVRQFTVAVSDAVGHLLMPDVLARISNEAPGVTLRVVVSPAEIPTDALATGAVDLVVAHHAHIPERLRVRRLFSQQLVVIARREHPAIKARLSLEQLLAARHVVVFPHAADVDVELQRVFRDHNQDFLLFATVQHTSVAARIVARTDAIAVFPERLARIYESEMGLRVFSVPKPLELPAAVVNQVWHERTQGDPGHRWLRETFSTAARALSLSE